MTAQDYQQIIIEGIDGLPQDILVEIADFVLFVRQRAMHPQAFAEEMRRAMLKSELKQLNGDQAAHLEKEFEDYERLYPRE